MDELKKQYVATYQGKLKKIMQKEFSAFGQEDFCAYFGVNVAQLDGVFEQLELKILNAMMETEAFNPKPYIDDLILQLNLFLKRD